MALYEWDRPDGTAAQPGSLQDAVDVAKVRLDPGEGPFKLSWGVHDSRPLDRKEALDKIEAILRGMGPNGNLRVRNDRGNVVFHCWRVEPVYLNPFRDADPLAPERIDDGVDYTGRGRIYPIGKARITLAGKGTSSGVGTWSMNTFLAYELLDGPAQGHFWYIAENYLLESGIHVGDVVSNQDTIAHMAGGIETGWANPPGNVDSSLAHPGGSYTGVGGPQGEETCYGLNASQLLHALGAPAGLPNGPVHGDLPPHWPTQWASLL